MRTDFEEFRLYTHMGHQAFDDIMRDGYIRNMEYYKLVGEEDDWFYKTSPYFIYTIMNERNTGIYEIWYDYIKRRVKRKSSVYDYGAGVGSLEIMLLKRYPSLLAATEYNLICMDFINWRLHQHKFELTWHPHYDYVVSIDTIHRLAPENMGATVDWLLSLGDRCFIHINGDMRHPFYNEVPFDIEEYLNSRVKTIKNFHGLWDVIPYGDEN